MLKYLSASEASSFLRHAQQNGLLQAADTAAIFFDFSILLQRLKHVQSLFPQNFKHTVAIKCNPLRAVLAFIIDNGTGLEAASYEEVCFAQLLGAKTTVWNSPAKTQNEMVKAKDTSGLMVNLDSLYELDLWTRVNPESPAILRINPEVAPATDRTMTVGHKGSKFGEPISNPALVARLSKDINIVGLHVHASSQTTDYSATLEAIGKTLDLAEAINERRNARDRLRIIDIGGGLAANYAGQDDQLMERFSTELLAREGQRLSSYTVITEFGRWYQAHAGFVFSEIAQVKKQAANQTLIAHVGADLFLREAYEPAKWPHRYAVVDERLIPKQGDNISTQIAGPLCFGGDYLSQKERLPEAESGNGLLILDTGANSIGLWSRHCSRAVPKVIGIFPNGEMKVIRERESIADVLSFWG